MTNLPKKAIDGIVEGAASAISNHFVGFSIGVIVSYSGVVVAIARENVIQPVCSYPLAFMAVIVLGGLIGFAIGAAIKRAAAKKYEARISELEKSLESKDARTAELEDELSRIKEKIDSARVRAGKFDRFKNPVSEDELSRIRRMDHHDKVMLKAAATKEFVFCRTCQTHDFYLTDVERFVNKETLRHDVSRLRPNSKLSEIAKNHADVLDTVNDDDLARRDYSLDSGVIARPRSNAGGRTWWWTDNPTYAEEFL